MTPPADRPALLLVSAVYPQPIRDLLDARFAVHAAGPADPLPPGLAERVVAVATDPGVGATEALMARLPALRMIGCYGVGTDAIDLAAAGRRGVAVSNTPGLLTEDVADLAVLLMLAAARGLPALDAHVRAGQWTTLAARVPLGRTIKDRTVGIVGLGRIGRAIAERVAAFRTRVLWTGPRPKPDVPWTYVSDLGEMARMADVLIVACRGGPETRGIVDAGVIDALGPDGILVNVARGSVVDEAALVDALSSGRLGRAGLDVFADEPTVPDALRALPNVVLSPHQGSATLETRLAMGRLLVENLVAFADGRPLPTPVATPAAEGRA
jgi:lactate dehydrogenase-like 2-hydroxyacid dehydrogenase